jgi:hypothetical protein
MNIEKSGLVWANKKKDAWAQKANAGSEPGSI